MTTNQRIADTHVAEVTYAADGYLAKLLDARPALRQAEPYTPLSLDDIRSSCRAIVGVIEDGLAFQDVARLGGGASKEQFILMARTADGTPRRYVVRTDPLESVAVSDRRREAEIMRAAEPFVPVPHLALVDDTCRYFRRPTLVMEFVDGVTKPTRSGPAVTGIGIGLSEPTRTLLKPQFVNNLATIHSIAPIAEDLPSHPLPRPNSKDAAQWQLAFWNEVWLQDALEPVPLMTVARLWMKRNLPVCERPVIVHADYRTGNYLFDQQSCKISAILDWELAHIGDHHEDVAHVLSASSRVFDAVWRASDLFEPNEWLDTYQAVSGMPIDPKTLHFYKILATYKSYVATVATAASVARAKHSHQDVLLTTLPALGPDLLTQLADLLETA